MDYKTEFQRLLDYHGVVHFTVDEVLYLGATNDDTTHPAYDLNEYPPIYLWCNIVDTLLVVEELRKHFGSPITILNAYRSPEYNRLIGGAPQSRHIEFNALDITVKGHEPMVVAQKLKEWRLQGRFKGGIGTYATFVHVDTRGTNATWEQ